MKAKTKRKLFLVLLAALIFSGLWSIIAIIMDIPLQSSLPGAFTIGFVYGLYEEFYVQSHRSAWMRNYNAVVEILFNIAVVIVLLLVTMNLNHLLYGRYDQISQAYGKLPVLLPVLVGFSALMVTVLRVIGYIGGKNLLYLIVGRYRRPQLENRVFLFLDMKDSTALVEQLGPLRTRELIGKLFYDISQPITDHDGEVYRYTGDGLVATWSYSAQDDLSFLIDTVDDLIRAVASESDYYHENYQHCPQFRIGIHCGEIVVSEEGDVKRAIGYYGETIHIAARLEQEAKSSNRDILFSAALVSQIKSNRQRLTYIGPAHFRGIRKPVELYQLEIIQQKSPSAK
jgi:class 3 adenylate cyclase